MSDETVIVGNVRMHGEGGQRKGNRAWVRGKQSWDEG